MQSLMQTALTQYSMLGEHQCSTGGRDNVMTCDTSVQKQIVKRQTCSGIFPIMWGKFYYSSPGFAGICKPPSLHKLLSLQGAQDIMSIAAGIGSMLFDEMQGKVTWLQGKFLQWQVCIAWKCHRNNISLWSISGFSASHFSL